ncbi:MAG TPA: hypothetical protein PLU91_09680, partial [Verrucomicrobiota bacterium]|nr:hypothetical protein [Verrucomicrobiota bacterium]
NRIFSNGALGIDLGNVAGPNAIIPCGTTGDANKSQNYPVLAQAVSGNGTSIRGMLDSKPNRPYLLQFFASPTCDPSGYGEGQFYLGQTTVVTGANCTNSFVANLPTSVPPGYSVITATATDGDNNTSEFSPCVPVSAAPPPPPLMIAALLSANQVRLAWTNIPGFVLKQTGSLSPPVQWAVVTNAPIPTNGLLVVPLPILTTSNRFFRLSFE